MIKQIADAAHRAGDDDVARFRIVRSAGPPP